MPSRQSPRPLSAGDLAGLELLRADRDSDDPQGVPASALQAAIGTRFLDSWLSRVRAHGYVIGIDSEGRYELGHAEPSTEASGEAHTSPAPPAVARGSSGVSVEGKLFELPSTPHYDVKAQAA